VFGGTTSNSKSSDFESHAEAKSIKHDTASGTQIIITDLELPPGGTTSSFF
jgi:hypothetical protein